MASNPFVHCELSVDDPAAARAFYKKVFDWKMQDLGPEMGNYVMLDTGTKTSGGGITAKMMPTQPTAWVSYVEVASVKRTMAKAVKAGATAVVPYQPVGSMGAIGVFVDPQGAMLGVWEKIDAKPAKKAAGKKPAKKAAGAAKKAAPAKKAAKKK